jgi:nicotinamidase-related amidase
MTQAALLIIDMQAEMQRRLDAGRDCVNPGAGAVIARLAAACRAMDVPVVHVRHQTEDGPFHPASPGYPPMPCAEAAPDEAVFVKTTSSAFASTGLEAHLRASGVSRLLIVGAVAGFCVNSTTRAASDLGFDCVIVEDGVMGFDLPGMAARPLFDATMALLAAGFAELCDSEAVCAMIRA